MPESTIPRVRAFLVEDMRNGGDPKKQHGICEVKLSKGRTVYEGKHLTLVEMRRMGRREWRKRFSGPVFFIIGKDKGKLGSFWDHAYLKAKSGLSLGSIVNPDSGLPDGKWMANTHQGHFPDHDSTEDGHAGIAAVAQYSPNSYGLYDITGNVWQWTSDLYRADYYAKLAATGNVVRNPHGPETSLDPDEPGAVKRVQRGGSFLCTSQYCSRYIVGTRGKGEVSSATSHIGFRCVKDRLVAALAQLRECPNNRRALLLRATK